MGYGSRSADTATERRVDVERVRSDVHTPLWHRGSSTTNRVPSHLYRALPSSRETRGPRPDVGPDLDPPCRRTLCAHREIKTETEKHRETETEKERDVKREAQKGNKRDRVRLRQRQGQRDIKKESQTETKRDRDRERHKKRRRQPDRDRDEETKRHRDKESLRDRETDCPSSLGLVQEGVTGWSTTVRTSSMGPSLADETRCSEGRGRVVHRLHLRDSGGPVGHGE